MQLLRFHYRKLSLFVVSVIIVGLLVLSQYNGRHGADQIHKASSVPYSLKTILKKEAKFDSPRLALHRTEDRQESIRLNKLFSNISQEWTCPTCIGNDLCEDISSGFLSLQTGVGHLKPGSSDGLVYNGTIGVQHSVQVKVPSSAVFQQVVEVLCGAAEGGVCGVKRAARLWPYITSPEPLSPSVLTRYVAALGGTAYTHPVLLCATPLSLSVLETSFTPQPTSEGRVSSTPSDKLNLLTALHTAPGYAVQKMAEQLQLAPSIVTLVGACGRAWVSGREQLTPLHRLLEESWTVRAGLGSQVLALVEDMLEGSEEWLVFLSRWSVAGLAVTGDGELLVSDAAAAAIVDKAVLLPGATGEYGEEDDFDTLGETCNKDCFDRLLSHLYDRQSAGFDATVSRNVSVQSVHSAYNQSHDHIHSGYNQLHSGYSQHGKEPDGAQCGHEDVFAHVMYASVCAYVLSDAEGHRRLDYFSKLHQNHHNSHPYKGVLHSPPDQLRPQLEQLLGACVEESSPGDRLRTVEQLKDLLADQGGDGDDGGVGKKSSTELPSSG